MVKKSLHAIDVQRFIEALATEERARKRLLRLGELLKSIYKVGGKPTDDEFKKLHRSVKRWLSTVKTAANVIGEQMPKETAVRSAKLKQAKRTTT